MSHEAVMLNYVLKDVNVLSLTAILLNHLCDEC